MASSKLSIEDKEVLLSRVVQLLSTTEPVTYESSANVSTSGLCTVTIVRAHCISTARCGSVRRLDMFISEPTVFERSTKGIKGTLPVYDSLCIMTQPSVSQIYEGMQTVSTLRQQYLFIPQNVKSVYLYHLLQHLENDLDVEGIMIFASSCASCKLLGYTLMHLSCDVIMLHSDLRQRQRLLHLEAFKSKRVRIMVATDLASRGLDIPSVDWVINYDLPHLPRDYVHRVGRTARAGRSGRAISFVTQYDIELLQSIEKLINVRMEAFEMKEAEVLKSMRRVFVARKAAMLQKKKEQKERKIKDRVMDTEK